MSHLLTIDGLAEAIASAPVTEKHLQLLAAVHQFSPYETARLATVRDEGARLIKRKVIGSDGTVIHDDHREWLRCELAADAGDAGATFERLRRHRYLLSSCKLKAVYLVRDRGGANQANFEQIEIRVEDERTDRELFSQARWAASPRDLRGLLDAADDGEYLPDGQSHSIRPLTYALVRVVDVARFVEESEELEAQRREIGRQRRIKVTHMDTGRETLMSYDQLSLGWDKLPSKTRRLFDDWSASSAGRSGARICDHWVMLTTDYTDDKGQRWLTLIPGWTFTKPLAKVANPPGTAYQLFGKLEMIDRRTKAPFAWYFYMLHGNKVDDAAGRRILAAAEEGLIVLPEHDYQVLKTWREQPYGF